MLAADNKTVIATLTLGDTYQANQLVNQNKFVYASTAPGILGANAGYYYRINPKGQSAIYAPQLNLPNDIYGTAVGDFLSLVNAGLLGATQPFAYNGNPSTQIGKLASLDPSYSVDKTTQTIKPSPWLDKNNGPVAKGGLFGSKAWGTPPPCRRELRLPTAIGHH